MDIDIASLNVWLMDKIKPLCVADPIPLSQYITALVRKDKPVTELIKICNEQLEVFLQDKTKSFVSDLFAALNSKSYMTVNTHKDISTNKFNKQKLKTKRSEDSHSKTSPNKKIRKVDQTSNVVNSRTRSHSPNENVSLPSTISVVNKEDHRSRRIRRRSRSRSHSSNESSHRSKVRRQCSRRGHSNDSNSDFSSSPVERRKRRNKQKIASEIHMQPQPPMPQNVQVQDLNPRVMSENVEPMPNRLCMNPVYYDACQNEIPGVTTSMWSDGLAAQNFSQWNRRKQKPHQSPPKNIISVPLTDNVSNYVSIGYEPTCPNEGMDSYHKQSNGAPQVVKPAETQVDTVEAPVEYKPSPITDSTEENGVRKQCSALLVTRIPWHLNKYKNLYDHFSQFGRIVNICCNFQTADHKALIEYSSPLEADAAYRSPEAVLNNRFIRLHQWGLSKVVKPTSNVRQRLGYSKKRSEDVNESIASKKNRPTGTRSRFRLERGENLEDSEDEELLDEVPTDSPSALMKSMNDSSKDDSSWVTQLNRKYVRQRQISESSKLESEAKREQEKVQALKEHKEKLIKLEQAKETKRKLYELLTKKLTLLTASMKSTIAEIEGLEKDESTRVRRKELIDKAKCLQKDMTAVKEELAIAVGKKPVSKGHSKQSSLLLFNSVMDSDAASEKVKKIEQINSDIEELMTKKKEAELENPDSVNQIVKKISSLKRELVEIETIKPSDLNNFRSSRIQTKIDKRPKTLYISTFTKWEFESYINILKSRFLHTESVTAFLDPNFVDVPGVDPGVVLEVTFCTRDFAETAMRSAKTFANRPLSMTFVKPEGLTRKVDNSLLDSPLPRSSRNSTSEVDLTES